MKVLNLYAGIGGNRKLWEDVEVTAVEWDKKIASVYQGFFPDNEIIVTEAQQYLLDNFLDYDFIWSSPPCPTHSTLRHLIHATPDKAKFVYPDMRLYQEIILLTHQCRGIKWVVENVFPYYDYLIRPSRTIGRHAYWSNFFITPKKCDVNGMIAGNTKVPTKLSS